jgi:hypothetical protein
VLFVVKYFGGSKGNEVPAQDTAKSQAAMEQAAELLGQRALVQAQTDDAKKKVEEALAIPDPAERLKALADQLKGL